MKNGQAECHDVRCEMSNEDHGQHMVVLFAWHAYRLESSGVVLMMMVRWSTGVACWSPNGAWVFHQRTTG